MRQPRAPRLRTVTLASSVAFGLLVVLLAVGQAAASRLVWLEAEQARSHAVAIDVAVNIERELSEVQLLRNASVAEDGATVPGLVSEAEEDLRRNLDDMDAHVGNAGEAALLARARADIDAWLADRRRSEATGFGLEHVLVATRGSFERALASCAELRAHNEADLASAEREARSVLRLQNVVVAASLVLMALGVVAVVLAGKVLVVRPVLHLESTMRRFREGDPSVRARGDGACEVRELARAFDAMADTIVRQRTDQLTFLAGVAHDLRDPISALKIGLQLFVRDPASMTTDRVQGLDRQLDRLARMVADLLDATRIEAGQLELRLADVDLRDVARRMVDLFASTTSAHEVTLEAPDHPVPIRADPLRIEQVLSNLIGNAVKYSPDGGPVTVEVSASCGAAEVAVTDRGVGIHPDDLAEVFQPFRRSSHASHGLPGVGLGLSIVRRIVNAHGGAIGVESALGRGSTFRVRLPLTERAGRELPGASPHATAG